MLERPAANPINNHYLLYPSSWEPKLNPYARLARDGATRWFAELGVIPNAEARRCLEEERADLYGGFPYPTANFEQLTTVTKFLALWMLFDDFVTERSADYWSAHGLTLDDYAEALRGGELAPTADPYLRGWWTLGRAFASRMSPAWCDGLSDYFVAWLRMTMRERETYTALRREGALPDPETYLAIRSVSVGVSPTFHFIEYVEGFELPDVVRRDPFVTRVHDLGRLLVLLSNDLASLEKDLASGWPDMITVTQRANDLTLEGAVVRVVEMHNAALHEFLTLEARRPSFGPAIDPFVDVLLSRVHHVVRGFAEFQFQAERYRWKNELAKGKGSFVVEIAHLR